MNLKFNIKRKILNHLTCHGKKQTSEKILLKGFKELQKGSTKQSKPLIKLALIFSTPIFQVHKITNKKNKNLKEIPIFLFSNKVRVSSAIKFILASLQKNQVDLFHKKFLKEIFSNLKNEGVSVKIKTETQKQALLKKNLLLYYRW